MTEPHTTVRAAIYARYSTDEQRPESIADQVALCRKACERYGWDVTAVYSDAALSGSNDHRPEYSAMKRDTLKRKYDVIVCESVDRLSRRLAEVAGLFDQLMLLEIKIYACDKGFIDHLLIGIYGGIAQSYLVDLATKTRRGMRGKTASGLSAGGIGFGYAKKEREDGVEGDRVIVPHQADIVRTIFRLYAGGISPRAIAARLNKESVPGPEGRPWGDTTIRGQVKRGTGILNNELYVGRNIWNRCSYTKNPSTGKRVARPNPPERWERSEVPHLRIIDDDLWNQVKERQKKVRTEIARDTDGNPLNRVHRKRHLLSGLLFCAECGAAYAMVDKFRYACPNHRSKGTCKNDVKIRRKAIEARIHDVIRHRLGQKDVVDWYMSQWESLSKKDFTPVQEELRQKRLARADLKRRIDNAVGAVVEGIASPALKAKLAEMEARLPILDTELEAIVRSSEGRMRFDRDTALKFHELFCTHVDTWLDDIDEESREPMAAIVRNLVGRIVIGRDEDGAEMITFECDLMEVVLATGWIEVDENDKPLDETSPSPDDREGLASVVAGARFELTTFRL